MRFKKKPKGHCYSIFLFQKGAHFVKGHARFKTFFTVLVFLHIVRKYVKREEQTEMFQSTPDTIFKQKKDCVISGLSGIHVSSAQNEFCSCSQSP